MEKLKNSITRIIAYLSLFLLLLNTQFSRAQAVEQYADITFDTLLFDIGKIDKTVKTITVNYKNDGVGKLTIYHVVTPCTCTTVSFNKDAISKGKKGKIIIQVDPLKLPLGPFTRTVTILHDGSDKGHDQIEITGIRQ